MDRRQFLTATAGAATLPAVVGGAPASTTQSSFGPLGRVSVPGIKETVVDESGTVAVAAVDDGFVTIDIADPANPTALAERRGLLADRPNGPMAEIYDVKYDDGTLLVVGPANSGSPRAALFFDVSDPAAPERLGVYDTGYPIHNSDFDDGIAYLTANTSGSNGLVMVDPNDGDPVSVGSWSITNAESDWTDVSTRLWSLHDVYVQDDIAYLAHWDAGTWIVDVSDPGSVEPVAKVRGRDPSAFAGMGMSQVAFEQTQPPGNDHYTAVNEDASLLGIGVESWDLRPDDGRGGPGGVTLWDISTPSDPQRLSRIDPPPSSDPSYAGIWTTSHNFDFQGDRLYTSWYQGGVRVFDISDPAAPVEIANYRNTDETSFWTARYATEDCFVAPSGEHPNRDLPYRLYTFPIPDDDPVAGPPTAVPDGNPAGTTTTAGGTTTTPAGTTTTPAETTTTPTGTTTTADAGGSATETDTPTTEASDAGADTTAGSGPGFGVLGALAGLGLGAWRLRERRGD